MATVCSINYINKEYSSTDAAYVATIHEDVEASLIKEGKGIIIKGANEANHFRPKSYHGSKYIDARNVVSKINKLYDGNVVQLQKNNKGREIIVVNVNPIADRRLFFYKDAVNKAINDPYRITDDGEVVNTADYNYEQRVSGLEDYETDTLDRVIEQAKEFESNFKKAGVNVVVILDGDQNSSGAVLSETNTKRQQMLADGEITNDTFVISINPKKLQKDTISHEFGHIFIDLIGGIDNARVKAAYSKLKSSPIFNQVKQLYPELQEDSPMFIKEVVNTALGRKTQEIFDKKDDKNWWDRFLDWFYTNVGKVFNIKKDTIQSLAEDLVNVQEQNFTVDQVNEAEYQQKEQKEKPKLGQLYKKASAVIDSIHDANRLIYSDIRTLVRSYEAKTGKKLKGLDQEIMLLGDIPQNRQEEARLYAMKELMYKYDEIVKGEEQAFLLEFTKQITQSSEAQLNYLNNINNQMDEGAKYKAENRLKMLNKVRTYSALYQVAERIFKDINNMGLTPENKKIVNDELTDAKKNKDAIDNLYVDIGRKIIVDLQAPNFDIIRTEYKDKFTVEYNQNNKENLSDIREGETKEEYVNRKMTDSEEEIVSKTRKFLNDQLRQSVDVGTTEMLLRGEKDINSTSIAIVSRILDKSDLNRNIEFTKYRKRAFQLFQEYSKKHGAVNPKTMYSDFIDETENGVYLLGEYKAEFHEKLNQLNEAVSTAYSNLGEEPDVKTITMSEYKKLTQAEKDARLRPGYRAYENAKEAKRQWLKDNTIKVDNGNQGYRTVPTDKWKNPKYSKIMSDPKSAEAKLYQFMMEVNDVADNATKGMVTLKRKHDKVDVIFNKIPIISKDSLEKGVDGEYAASFKDTVERLYKYKEDEGEVGQMDQEDNNNEQDRKYYRSLARTTQATLDGKERHMVPIYFREGLNKNSQSKDLMSAYMMNLFMSLNFKEKSDAQVQLDVILNVTGAKRSLQTQGMKNLLKIQKMSENELRAISKTGTESVEYKKLQSMLENRLYGIKTMPTEFGKIAETIMGWTGTTMLALNFYSGMANLVQGKTMNFIESIGSEFFTPEDLKIGEQKFFGDMGNWISDIGSLENESKTMMLLDLLDPQGDFRGLKDRYVRNTRAKSLTSRQTLSFPNEMGEKYIQSTLMYSILHATKVLDKDGNYLDKDFRPTKDKKKAIGMDAAIQFVDGNYTMNEKVHNTTFTRNANGDQEKLLLDTKNLVKKITADLHGQYDSEVASHAQRSIFGKMAFMLRKWLQPGIDRRWRGTVYTVGKDWRDFNQTIDTEDDRLLKYYSQDTKSFREGSYATAIRFFRQLHSEGEMLNIFLAGKTKTWSKMNDHEKANVRRWAMEFAIITLSIISAWILKGLASELPEDEEQAVLVAAFLSRRLHQELVAYSNPIEALHLLRSPAASISMVQNSLELIGRVGYDGVNVIAGNGLEEYQTGKRKGTLKIAKEFKDVVPVLSQVDRNLEDVMEYAFKMY